MALPQDEQVRYDVQLNAQAAIQVLKQLLAGIEGTDAKVVAFSTHLVNLSKQWNVPWRDLLNTIRQVNNELSKTGKGGTLFGNIGGRSQNDLLNMSDKFLSSAEAAGRLSENVDKTSNSMQKADGTAHKYGRSLDALRIAMGTIVAMAIFRTINFIEESMRKAITTAKEYETSLYRIANVEQILSQAGIETSVEGLRDIIRQVKSELPIFSEADITQQVSLIGIMTKELGVTEMQIGQISKAIGVLNVRSGETEDLLTTTNKVLTAMVAPSGRGIASLGLDFGEANIEATAFANGVLKAGESFKDLTDHEKDMIKIAILLESTGQELQTIQDFLETNTGALAEQEAVWEDTLRMAGQALIALQAASTPLIIGFLKFLQDAINGMKAFIVIMEAAKNSFMVFAAAVSTFFNDPLTFIRNLDGIKQGMAQAFSEGLEDGFNKFFSGVIPDDAPEWFKRLFGEFAKDVDTSTESVENLGDAITDLPGFDDLIKDLERLGDRLEELQFQFDLESARDLEDFLRDMERMLEDFARKRQSIIDDANDKTDDANRKHRNKEIDEEARFQEQMRQLREKFLFNLEDALRERDARQVLRLQAQYAMDKKALENEHALRKKENDRQHEEDLERIRKERDDRLKELEEEERIKRERAQEDFELEQKRKAEDHQHDLEQLQQQINDRLMEFARAIGEEFGLNEEGVNALYNLLQQYYGPDGLFSGLYDYSYEYLVSRAQAMLEQVNAIVAAAQAAIASVSGMLGGRIPEAPPRTPSSIPPQAKGGTYFANRPTRTTFGESGPELAMFIPLRGSKGMSGGAPAGMSATNKDGTVDINLWLSSDLESRIVGNTLNETAKVFTKVRRSK